MLLKVTSKADDVANIQARLQATLIDLEQPLVRITDQVSDLHSNLKGTFSQKICEISRLIMTREREKRASKVAFPCSRSTTLQGGIGICTIWLGQVAHTRSTLCNLEGLE
jgi:hypothetical protein